MFGFNCPYCPCGYSDEVCIIEHLKEKHNKTVFPCKICKKLLSRKDDLKRHISHAHGESKHENFQCLQCEYKTKRKENLNKHVKNKHEKAEYKCDICSKTFNWKQSMMKHKKTHEETKQDTHEQFGEGENPDENPVAGNSEQNNQGQDNETNRQNPTYEENSSFNQLLLERIYRNIKCHDILVCLGDLIEEHFRELFEDYFKKFRWCKFYIVVQCNLEKFNQDGFVGEASPYFHSKTVLMQGMYEFDELMNKAKARINRRFENYISQGSGWIMKSIEKVTVKLTGLHRRQS